MSNITRVSVYFEVPTVTQGSRSSASIADVPAFERLFSGFQVTSQPGQVPALDSRDRTFLRKFDSLGRVKAGTTGRLVLRLLLENSVIEDSSRIPCVRIFVTPHY